MRKKRLLSLLFGSAVLLSGCNKTPTAEVVLPPLIGNNMVFQRDIPLKLWGESAPGADIRVQFQNKIFDTRADSSGEWSLLLDSYPAGGPYELVINRDTLRNVLIGDIWVCSGQSNMEWPLLESSSAEEVMNNPGNPQIRVFQVSNRTSQKEEKNVSTLFGWEESTLESIAGFSGVGYLFARELQKDLNIPIGIVSADWGGSPIEVWLSNDILSEEERSKQKEKDAAYIRYQEELKEWNKALSAADKEKLQGIDVLAEDCDVSGWDTITMPRYWEATLYPGFDGLVYLRKEFTLDKLPSSASVTIGCVDDKDETYINGVKVGNGEGFNTPRTYGIPDGVLKQGSNVIVIRVIDNGGNGGIRPIESLLHLTCEGERIPLNGIWNIKPSLALSEFPEQPRGSMWENSYLYNAMLAPLTEMPIKGVIWYQGESNVWTAGTYKDKFEKMVADWRSKWNMGDFPFLFVQLANFKVPGGGDREWAELRQAQLESLSIPNTGMAVAIDIGEADNIHPVNKAEVARRLRLAADRIAYGKDIVYTGPLYQGYQVNGNRLLVSFDGVGGGLKSSDGKPLRNFEISGADGKWYPAQAEIKNDQVVVYSPEVKQPAGVRYAWESAPENVNFYNAEGLPASPFTSK
ncbi:MAG: sialate O-acetylesterase [Bacteroidales bacterium]|nr:sialate O-acetylesterase [Bacteroidales bacterium]